MTEQNLHWLSATEMVASVASNSLSPNEIAAFETDMIGAAQ